MTIITKSTATSTSIKENNGHAAITRRRKRLLVPICIILSVMILLFMFMFSSTTNNNNNNNNTIVKWNTILSTIKTSQKQAQQKQRHVVQKQQKHNADDDEETSKQQQSIYEKEGDIIPEGIRTGYLHLIDVQIERSSSSSSTKSNIQVYGTFCRLDWSIHKNTPSKYPMYRDIIQYSKDNSICSETTINNIPLIPLYNDLQKIDISIDQYQSTGANTTANAIHMKIGGIVFHESRCGSTLICNLLISSNPTLHRVYSESSPPLQMLSLCNEHYSDKCTIQLASELFHKTLYIMSRRMIHYTPIGDEEETVITDELEQETTVFFKIQSIGSRYIQTFLHAYPPYQNDIDNDNSIALDANKNKNIQQTSIPWIFVYRHPIHVMMSHLKYGPNHANCYRNYINPPNSVQAIFTKYNNSTLLAKKVDSNTNIRIRNNNKKLLRNNNNNDHHRKLPFYQQQVEYYCAAHLASITESIVTNYYSSKDNNNNRTNGGIVINYSVLPNIFYSKDNILQNHFHIIITNESIQRMKLTATQYSKGRTADNAGKFTTDNKEKEQMATNNVKDAVNYYLQSSYNQLEQLATSTGTTTTTTTTTTIQ